MKLQLNYEIMFGYVQKLQIAHLIPVKTLVKVYNKFGAGNQPFCNLIAITKDAIIDI